MANDYVGWGLILGIEDSLNDFINDATEVVNSLGTGLPPRDLAAFTSQSTEDGIKLTFTPPAQTYIDDGGTNQFAVMPAGVLIRYSDTGYPRTPDEGKFGYDYKPTGDWVTTSQECTIVGLTKDTKYYFTAFPYSTEHVYNKNQVTANRTEMTWVGNKGTISVTVNTPEGYEGTLGEYTITLVDQASDSPQNVEKSATGAGLTQFGGLTAGKTYKVRLSSTSDLQAPPDSEAITIVGGVNYDVTMTYALMYGTITVNVTTQPAGMPIGQYTVTLTPNDSTGPLTQQGNNSQAVVFNNVKNGVVYTVGLSAINHYTANANGTVTAVGGQNTQHNAQYVFSGGSFSQLSWNEIRLIANAGAGEDYFNVGDEKTITAYGDSLVVQIYGFNHDDLTSGGKANITVGTKGVMDELQYMNGSNTNSGGFGDSWMFDFLNETVYNSLDNDLKQAIKSVKKKYYSNGNRNDLKTKDMKLFILCNNETGPTDEGVSCPEEGNQYPIFTGLESKVKEDSSGTARDYWTRTPGGGSRDNFSVILANRGISTQREASSKLGVCFAFCI